MEVLKHRFKLSIIWPSVIILSLAVLLFVFSLIAYVVVTHPAVQDRAVRFAEEQIAGFFHGDITVERVSTNLLSYVEVHGVRAVGRSEHRDSIYVGHIRANYWIPALLFKTVRVTSARVTDVRAHVVMEEGNDIMIPFIPTSYYDSTHVFLPNYEPLRKVVERKREKSGGEEEKEKEERVITWPPTHITNPADWKWKVALGRARVDGITAVYRDLSNEMVGEIRNATVLARFHAIDSFSVSLRVPGGSYHSPWWSGAIDTIGVSGCITWFGLEVHNMLFKGSGTQITAGGRLSYFEGGPWDLKANFITSIRPATVLYEHVDDLGRDGFFEGVATFGGTLYEPIYGARVKGSGVTLRGHELAALDVEASYGRDEYGRARIRGAGDFGNFDVTASLLMKQLMRGPEFGGYSALASLSGLDAAKIAKEFNFDLPLAIERGDVRVRADGKCFEIPDAVELSATFTGADLPGGDIDFNASLKNSKWDIDGSWGENRFEGHGRVNIATSALSGSAKLDMPDPSTLAMTAANEYVSGNLSAAVEFSGRWDRPEKFNISADLKGEGITWRGLHADSLEAKITLDKGEFNLHRADGIISGWIDSLAPLLDIGAVGGYIQAEVSMKGGLTDPIINTRFRGRELRYEEYALDTAAGFASMESGVLNWNNLYLRGFGTSVHSSGRFRLPKEGDEAGMEGAITAELFAEKDGEEKPAGKVDARGAMRGDSVSGSCRITSVPLDIFDRWIPEEHRVKGMVSLSGDFSGTVTNPTARVNFRLTDPSYGDYSAYSVIGDAALADSLVNGAALLRVSGNSGAIELKASVPFLPSSDWKIDESGTRTALVGARAESFSVREAMSYLGDAAKGYEVSGAAAFDVSLTNQGSGWNVGGMLYIPDADVRFVEEEIGINNATLNASLSGTLEKPSAAFTLATGVLDMPLLRIDSCVIRGRTGVDTLFIDSARVIFRDGGNLDIRARMLYDGLDSLMYNRNFYAQYRIDNVPSTMFARMIPGIRMRRGLFNGSGVIYGADGRPMADGTLSMTGLEMTLPDISPTLGPIDANIRLSGGTAELTSLNARWGRGAISGAGRVLWGVDGLSDMDLRVNAGGIFFELPEVVNVGIQSAALRITDQGDNIIISGRAVLGHTSYVRDMYIFEMVDQMRIGADVRREPNPFLQSILLRIDVDLANNLNIDMNMGTLTMDGRITVGGTAAEPGIVGEIRVRDGFVYYLDRKFLITEGTLFNPDITTVNPNLKITAKADVVTFSPNARAEQFTITLNMSGTLESPVVRFTSEPTLSELDILSILTFGERMGGMGSDIGNRIANLAAQQAIGLGTRRLEKMLNVDRVSVSGDVIGAMGGAEQSAGATIGVSKRFTTRLNVTYETNTVKLTDRKVTAQYRLLPNLYLEGQTTSEGENALDLIFRYSR